MFNDKMIKKNCIQTLNPKGYWVVVDTVNAKIPRHRPLKLGPYKNIPIK